jgi:hypothetical protein
MERVSAGSGNDFHSGASRGAKFRREGVLINAELLNAFGAHPGDAVLASSIGDGDGLGVNTAGIHAIHQERHQAHRLSTRIQAIHALLEHVAPQVLPLELAPEARWGHAR